MDSKTCFKLSEEFPDIKEFPERASAIIRAIISKHNNLVDHIKVLEKKLEKTSSKLVNHSNLIIKSQYESV